MNWISVPVFMMSAVSSYVGLYYLWMYTRRGSEREQLSFAAMCFVIGSYDFFCAMLYNARTLDDGMFWQRLQFASLAVFIIAAIWFVYDFAHFRVNKLFYILLAYFFLLFILGLVIHNEWTLSLANPMPKSVRLGIINTTYYEVDPGIIYKVQYVSMMACYIWVLYAIIKDYRSGNKKIVPLLISLIVFFFATVNDVLVGAAVYPFIYLLEYVYMIIILSMAYMLMNRFVRLHKQVRELNVNLEHKVKERTEELHTAMDELEATNDRLFQTNVSLEESQRIASLDMAMAAGVQASLFPKEAPASDEWDIAFLYRPMAGVSGDLFDFYVIDGRLYGLALFDVSGHGIASGLFTLMAKSILSRNVSGMKNSGLGKIIGKVNVDLKSELSNVDNYLSGIMLRFKENRVEYVNAGHHALLLRRADTGIAAPVKPAGKEPRGALLGLNAVSSGFDVVQFPMSRDDVLVLYTDGLDESENATREQYGLERILSSFAKAPGISAQDILDIIKNDFFSFLGTRRPSDDLTVIAVRRKI